VFKLFIFFDFRFCVLIQNELAKVEEIRGTPLSVGSLEEVIDEQHAIVSTGPGPEHYVTIMSFVNQDLLEPGCSSENYT